MEWWQRVRGRVTAAGVELSVRDLGEKNRAGSLRVALYWFALLSPRTPFVEVEARDCGM